MHLNDLQTATSATAIYPTAGQGLAYTLLGLAGETGELCNKYKKVLRDDGGKLSEEARIALADELGDCLWYVSQIAVQLDYKLDDIALAMLAKLARRKQAGTLRGAGDKR